MKYVILISHEFYGSCYLTETGEITKDRNEAKRFDYEPISEEKVAEKKFNCKCYATAITNK